jgi:hypothetical protein
VFMVKWALASIPALLVLIVIGVGAAMFFGILGGITGLTGH